MSNYLEYAKRELELLGYHLNEKDEGPNKWIVENIFELLKVFYKQGHSGFSANYCIELFYKLVKFEPLSPLTGKDDEWQEIGDNEYQNKRYSSVLKTNDKTFDIRGKIFRLPDGTCYSNSESSVDITFPYTPTTIYIDVKE